MRPHESSLLPYFVGGVAGVVTVVLLFATFPALGPAVTSSTAEFAHQLGSASDRAADVPKEH